MKHDIEWGSSMVVPRKVLACILAVVLVLGCMPALSFGQEVQQSEMVPQATIASAKNLALDTTVDGHLSANSTVYYRIVLPSSGYLKETGTSTISNYAAFNIYDAQGKIQAGTNVHIDGVTGQGVLNNGYYLNEGTYYLSVEGPYSKQGDYRISTEFTATDETFREPEGGSDNSFDSANDIDVHSEIIGQISYDDETDCFKVDLDSSGLMSIESAASFNSDITVYDEKYGKVWFQSRYTDAASGLAVIDDDIFLVAGTYYISISKSYKYGTYKLNTDFTPFAESFKESQTQKYNSLETASPIELEQEYRGMLAENDSVDFYSFTLPVSAKIVLSGKFDLSCEIALYDKLGNKVDSYYSYTSSTTKTDNISREIVLKPGDYYVSVHNNNFNTGTYSLGVAKAAVSHFSDLGNAQDWFVADDSYIQYVYGNKLMTGLTGTNDFAPNATLTRAMVATILYRAATGATADDAYADTDTTGLSDVGAGTWYTAAVNWAKQNGVVTGYGDNTFMPDKPVTREELALMLYRYTGQLGVDTSNVSTWRLKGMKDYQSVHDWAYNGVVWATDKQVITGNNGYVLPGNSATRAEMAKMVTITLRDIIGV